MPTLFGYKSLYNIFKLPDNEAISYYQEFVTVHTIKDIRNEICLLKYLYLVNSLFLIFLSCYCIFNFQTK